MSVTVFPAASNGPTSKNLTTQIITSTQSWTAPTGVTTIEIMLVAGGGAGGSCGATYQVGGGGGGGGVLIDTVTVNPGTSYTVTIGAGGSVITGSSGYGNIGANSTFGSLRTSYGGGGGTSGNGTRNPTTNPLGSGGGQGNALGSANAIGGPGGGAAIVPFIYNMSNSQPTSYETYNIVQGSLGFWAFTGGAYTGQPNPGINGYGAGGGPGGQWSVGPYKGGLNAGTGSGNNVAAVAATANLGGGGGGGYNSNSGSAGGSGVCIIRYWS